MKKILKKIIKRKSTPLSRLRKEIYEHRDKGGGSLFIPGEKYGSCTELRRLALKLKNLQHINFSEKDRKLYNSGERKSIPGIAAVITGVGVNYFETKKQKRRDRINITIAILILIIASLTLYFIIKEIG